MRRSLSDNIRHFFHIISNIRPIVWIGLYICLTPVFATIYWALPDGQFRIPDNAGTDWGSWLYYSIVTITTLGFGDYTPAHAWAQAVTAVEVMCGLVFLGFFLNAVGSMKSEIDIETEKEKQRRLHFDQEQEKLMKISPSVIHSLNLFLTYCYGVTTPLTERSKDEERYNPDFDFRDMADLFKPSGFNSDRSGEPVVVMLIKSASHASLILDSLQLKVDLTLWPEIMENCFAFVANYQMFSASDILATMAQAPASEKNYDTFLKKNRDLAEKIAGWQSSLDFTKDNELQPVGELYFFIKENASLALKIEEKLTRIITNGENNA